jgi:glucan phosphorylase
MKAAANGVLQLTVEDGWTAEVDWHNVGWTLDSNHLTETLYFRLERDIVPEYYKRNEHNLPLTWINKMRQSIRLSDYYNTGRMLQEYRDLLYQG